MTRGQARHKLGLEMEMVVAERHTGRSVRVERYFDAMAGRKRARGLEVEMIYLGGQQVGVRAVGVDSGIDNGFNHLESALGPVAGSQALLQLFALAEAELADVLDALQADNALLLNASEHPCCRVDQAVYRQLRAPKPIYADWTGYRCWSHAVGIDAKAQNGPTTAVPLENAAAALNVVLALAPASIALSANSPLENGHDTGLQENRLTIWPRMFATARFAGDQMLAQLPAQPFDGLGAYFRWAYGAGTVMHAVPLQPTDDYKGAPLTYRPVQATSLLDFLAAEPCAAEPIHGGPKIWLEPSASHFEYLQFAPFLDARYRFRFGHLPERAELLQALAKPEGIERLMLSCNVEGYIEGRMPGAGFADAVSVAEMGMAVARSVLIGPSAVQQGLLGNLEDAQRLVSDWSWARLRELRAVAVRDGLADPRVHRLAGEVLAVARAGLPPAEQALLAGLQWAWQHRRSGADRLRETWHRAAGDTQARLARLVQQHAVLHPAIYGHGP